MSQRIAVGGIILWDRKVLIIQRSSNERTFPNLWELPSGKKEEGESIKEAAIREVKEETGLDVEIIKPVSSFDYQIERDGKVLNCHQINFLVRPKGNLEVKLSPEHQAFAWINRGELSIYSITGPIREVIEKVFELE